MRTFDRLTSRRKEIENKTSGRRLRILPLWAHSEWFDGYWP